MSRRFSQILKRQTSLNHLCQVPVRFWTVSITSMIEHFKSRETRGCLVCHSARLYIFQASRTVINSADITFQMLEDWRNVDLNSITKQTLYTMEDSQEEHRRIIIQRKSTEDSSSIAKGTPKGLTSPVFFWGAFSVLSWRSRGCWNVDALVFRCSFMSWFWFWSVSWCPGCCHSVSGVWPLIGGAVPDRGVHRVAGFHGGPLRRQGECHCNKSTLESCWDGFFSFFFLRVWL